MLDTVCCIIELQSQEYFSPDARLNDDSHPVVRCGQRNSNTLCTILFSTEPDQFDLNNKITSTLNAEHTLFELALNTTYYFQFSLQESDNLSVAEVVQLPISTFTGMA